MNVCKYRNINLNNILSYFKVKALKYLCLLLKFYILLLPHFIVLGLILLYFNNKIDPDLPLSLPDTQEYPWKNGGQFTEAINVQAWGGLQCPT